MVYLKRGKQPDIISNMYFLLKSRTKSSILLSTAIVKVKDSQGKLQIHIVILDSACQSNFITENYVKYLGLRKIHYSVLIMGINNAPTNAKYSVDIQLFSMYSSF